MSDLVEIVKSLGTPRILVVGDLMLDHYTYGNADRISQEAPVMALEYEREEYRLGGAANVALMAKALSAEVSVAGVVGSDNHGVWIVSELERQGANAGAVLSHPHRPTTTKHRFMGQANGSQPQQVLRIDRESREPICKEAKKRILQEIDVAGFDAVLISDYGKGVCTHDIVQCIIRQCWDSQVPSVIDPCRSTFLNTLYGADAITPNRSELFSLIGRGRKSGIPQILDASQRLHDNTGGNATVFATIDSDGIVLVSRDADAEHFPTRPRRIFDVTGAGDAVLAMIGLCQAEKVPLSQAAQLANIAGGLEVERIGCVPITREEVIADLGGTASPRRIVFTNGCFDLLHIGHVRLLEAAKREGDYLIVGINCDATVRKLKGEGRPVIPEQNRADMLRSLRCVDEVRIFHEETPHRILEEIRPAVLVKGESTREVIGREVVEAYGGEVKILPGMNGVSTTQILQKIR